jgi:hypothetical protein
MLLVVVVLCAIGCGGGGSGSTRGAEESDAHAQQPNSQGAEARIEGYGGEATGSSRAAVLAAFHRYLEAIGAGEYSSACANLAGFARHSLGQLAGEAGSGLHCAAILPEFLTASAGATARQQVAGAVRKVRVQGERAFIVFHAPGARLYQMTMTREGGRWKVATVSASVLAPSAAVLGG